MPHSINTTAIVLAAGKGQRFGGDKLLTLVPPNQYPMGLQSALNISPFVSQVLCITRPSDTRLASALQQHSFTCLPNPDFKTGMASSIAAGVSATPDDHNLLIVLGDMPFISTKQYQNFFDFIAQDPQHICRPFYQQQPGHPVFFPKQYRALLMNLSGDQGAQSVLQENMVRKFAVAHTGFCKDVDCISDLDSVEI